MARYHHYHQYIPNVFILFSLLLFINKVGEVSSIDSLNLDLEFLDQIDLSPLGVPNLDIHQAEWDVTVDETCSYLLRVSWFKSQGDWTPSGGMNFQGPCEPRPDTGNAADDLPYHEHRRHWTQFPPYVEQTTGFNHMSIYWRPCGLPPKGFKQNRQELNLYMVTPHYRVFMDCETYQTPVKCALNQTTPLGRSMFSIPRLERDPNFLANMPLGFQPDPEFPEAYQYEGLTHFNGERIPMTTSQWVLPQFLMSTHDGDTVKWQGLLPHTFISGNSSTFSGNQFYVYQTMPRLPAGWNMTYDARTGNITTLIYGSAGMCGDGFEAAKAAANGEEDGAGDTDGEGGSADGEGGDNTERTLRGL